jgi:hypothetical protein
MKILIALMGLIAATGAFADESARLAERLSCSDVQAKIVELSGVEDMDDATATELENLKIEYRSKCSRSAAKRKSSAVKNTVVPASVVKPDLDDETETTVETEIVEPVTEEQEIVATEEVVVPVVDEEALLEQELANLDAGLCTDGTEPNKFGCCAGEIFRDLGNSVFACCPKDAGKMVEVECFPPIK